jgi:hypothetical protein
MADGESMADAGIDGALLELTCSPTNLRSSHLAAPKRRVVATQSDESIHSPCRLSAEIAE